jgi:N-acetylglutamate synthase-like GNAT family acetyltransferase
MSALVLDTYTVKSEGTALTTIHMVSFLVSRVPLKGLGTRLMEQLDKDMKEEGIENVFMNALSDKVSFYEKKGWKVACHQSRNIAHYREIVENVSQRGFKLLRFLFKSYN